MKELIISQIAPIAATAIVAILVATIKTIGNTVVDVLTKKKEQIEQSIKASGHEQDLQTAKEVWNIVEEKFRITENAETLLSSKADQFNNLLLQKIPGLTQRNLDDLRQAIAGEFNKDKAAVLTKDDALKQLQDTNEALKAENISLKEQADKAQALFSKPVGADTKQATA
ncbi:cobalt ABC transporter permease [Candidatus Clostridium helianthi]|uniref:Cobalt ABC transporter permease n=1 Tax=Candidatus Clostridium helianthi TaxID=3381660 RepID=A0ABW8SC52_9CLOT